MIFNSVKKVSGNLLLIAFLATSCVAGTANAAIPEIIGGDTYTYDFDTTTNSMLFLAVQKGDHSYNVHIPLIRL